MKKRRGYSRTDRVSQQLHEVLACLLLMEVKDPRLGEVQITAVDVSPDLRHAQVYYVLLDSREPSDEVQTGLEKAAGFLQRELGERLKMKFVPRLEFRWDESVERGRRIEELLGGLDTPPAPDDDGVEGQDDDDKD